MDILDLYRGRMSWRRFAVLFRQLPDDSRTVTALVDAQRDQPRPPAARNAELPTSRWGQTEQLLADIRDGIRSLGHLMMSIAAAQANQKPPPPPEPLPRPTDPRKAARAAERQQEAARKLASFHRLAAQRISIPKESDAESDSS